jgi:hypothetical protein
VGSRRLNSVFLLLISVWVGACRPPEPREELELTELETYWVVDSPVDETQYIAPAVRITVRNKGQKPRRSIEVRVGFRLKGESENWGQGDSQRVTAPGKDLAPGQSATVVLRNDTRYTSPGPPESMFTHAQFRDTVVQVFLRVGSSGWIKFSEVPVERRIGSHAAKAD